MTAQEPRVGHVLLIGIDGLSPEGIRRAETSTFDSLMASGTYTMRAQAVVPTVSGPNWLSVLTGVGPERHKVTSNDWRRDRGREGAYPTIVTRVRRARPRAAIGVFHDWNAFGRLVEPGAATVVRDGWGPRRTVAAARRFLARRPLLTIVHLDHVDRAGHNHGWLSPGYLAAVEEADRLTGELVARLRELGLLDRTAIIVTSDHGGFGKDHGGPSMPEVEIPWIAAGAGIAGRGELDRPVMTTDTAPTIAELLGVSLQDGRPVWEALADP